MPIITADETRTRLATPLTADQLDSKYGLVQALIKTAADEGRYSVPVTLGTDDVAQFTTWIQGYGYRLLASDTAGTQIRKIVGTPVNLSITWRKVTATVPAATVIFGNALYVNVASVGLAASTTLYWRITGTIIAGEFLENTLTGTVNVGSDGSGSVTLNIAPLSYIVGKTIVAKFYWTSDRTDLAATAPTVTVTA
jgi:hypothetical protein